MCSITRKIIRLPKWRDPEMTPCDLSQQKALVKDNGFCISAESSLHILCMIIPVILCNASCVCCNLSVIYDEIFNDYIRSSFTGTAVIKRSNIIKDLKSPRYNSLSDK